MTPNKPETFLLYFIAFDSVITQMKSASNFEFFLGIITLIWVINSSSKWFVENFGEQTTNFINSMIQKLENMSK